MTMTQVELGYGKVNLSHTSATFSSMKVSPPFVRVSAVTSGKRTSGTSSAAPVGRHNLNGILCSARVEHEIGTVILLQVSWKRQGLPVKDGALFIRLRDGAPVYRITAKLPMGPENLHGPTFAIFNGQGDIMNAADLTLIGLQVNRSYTEKFMADAEVQECFELSQLMPARSERPTVSAVATPEGLQLSELPQMPRRRLRFHDRTAK